MAPCRGNDIVTGTEPIEAGWIECPHCEGSGGWYGCYDCGESVAGDATEFEERGRPAYCARCQMINDCADDGGHDFGPVVIDPETHWASNLRSRSATQYMRECACGARRRVKATWSGNRGEYVEIEGQ